MPWWWWGGQITSNWYNGVIWYVFKQPLSDEHSARPGQCFYGIQVIWILNFSFFYTGCHSKVKESTLPCYFSIAGWRIVRFTPFLKALTLYEMQTAGSRVWIQTAKSISNKDNCYAMRNLNIQLGYLVPVRGELELIIYLRSLHF